MRKLNWNTLCVAGLLAFAGWPAHAETYPDRTITLIAPFAPGGASDVLARTLADGLSKELKQSVIVENHAGAGGTIGIGLTAAATPDGYTIVLGGNGSLVFSEGVYKLAYSARKDLRPVSMVGTAQSAVVVKSSLEVNSLQDLVKRSKEEPKLTYGSPGVGSVLHLAGAMFNKQTGGQLVHIPYKGLAPALTDLQAGNIDVVFANITSLIPFLEGNRIKPLAVIDDRRSKQLPDLPTASEEGVKGVSMITWYGIMAPAQVPDDRIKILEDAIANVLKTEAFNKTLETQGFDRAPEVGSANFAKVLNADFDEWLPLIASLGLKPQN